MKLHEFIVNNAEYNNIKVHVVSPDYKTAIQGLEKYLFDNFPSAPEDWITEYDKEYIITRWQAFTEDLVVYKESISSKQQ